jgi:photosystem II stability/assembly factor-like uncharacterized protein
MKTINLFFLALIIFTGLITGCKKSSGGGAEAPIVPVLPDTIPSGWARVALTATSANPIVNDIYFTNSSVGYAGSVYDGIFKSVNGGTTWNKVGSHAVSNISVTNDGKAFFVGNSNSVIKSLDGGVSFIDQVVGSDILRDVFFSGNTSGLAVSNTQLFATTDAGISWNLVQTLNNPNNKYSTSFMFDNTHAWIVYDNRIVHASANLNSWQTDTLIPQVSNMSLIAVWATSASTVYTCSYSGYLYKSTNGGSSFTFLQKLNPGNISNFSDLHFIDASTGYLSVGSRLYKTTDAGATWQMVLALGNTSIIEIHFADANHGWAGCNDGTILKLN